MIGSMPHTNAEVACSVVMRHLPDIPTWPQLPKRNFLENMYAQFSQGFPGAIIEEERLYVDRVQDLSQPLEQLYVAYLEDAPSDWAIGENHAAGLRAFLNATPANAVAVKGQITGPVSFGLSVTDQERRPILYDEVLADAVAKHLRLKASWQEQALRQLSEETIVFIDEPYMSTFGSAYVSISREQVIQLLEEVLQGITGVSGVHCCGNTDWSVLLATSVDVLSLDAYEYGETISLYPDEVKAFFEKNGNIAWGLIPNEDAALAKESVASLIDRWEAAAAALSRKGIPAQTIRERCLVTPSCGLASMSEEGAESALEMTAQVSKELQRRYL
jgi:methionine synthase II (cobalamin-independent)